MELWTLSFGSIRNSEAVPGSGRSIFQALRTQSRNQCAHHFMFAH